MRRTSQIAIVGAILALVGTFVRNNGNYDPLGLIFLALALILIAVAALDLPIPLAARMDERLLFGAITVVILTEAVLFCFQPLFSDSMPRWTLVATGTAVFGCTLVAVIRPTTSTNLITWIIVVIVFAFGVCVVKTHGDFYVDVRLFQEIAVQSFVRGVDPYIAHYPNMYSSAAFYGANNVDAEGWLKVGFMYPPLTFIFCLPGAIFGDVRYSYVLAMTASAAAIGFARPGRLAVAAVAMFALMPRTVYFLAGGWSEPLSIMLLTGTIWAASRRAGTTTGVLSGLLIASKQYLVVAAPLWWLLGADYRERIRITVAAVIAAMAVTAPFALWHPVRFFESISFHLRQPLRTDSLSFLAVLARSIGAEHARVIGVVVIVIIFCMAGIIAVRSAGTPAKFALSVALVVAGLFAFSQQAFLNYYVLAFAALAAALATSLQNAERAVTGKES